MVATTDINAGIVIPKAAQLKHGALSLPETIGQSIANIAPTLTPALNISVVAGLAGVGSWLSYLIATIGCVFVGACIATLAKRHPEAGSYFVYIGRNFGPITGALAGWAMVLAYLTTAVAVVFGFPLFLGNFLAVFHVTLSTPELLVFSILFLGLVTFAAIRDIQVSSRIGLVMETISIGIIIIITAIVVGKHGTIIDPTQLDISKLHFGGRHAGHGVRGVQLRRFRECRDACQRVQQPAPQCALRGGRQRRGCRHLLHHHGLFHGAGDA